MMGNYGAEGQALNLQWIEYYNDSGEEIPAFGVMRISGMRKKDGRPVIECKKPHTFGSQGQHRINGPVPVESSQYGVCLIGNHVAALYDTADGTPAFGESWGPRDGTWKLKKNTGGFRVLGNADTTNGVVVVVSVPMMLDRGTDTIVAALTSVRALFGNPGPLLLWATLIVLIVGLGFATLFIGLVIAVPLIGHATWHAYRDTVDASSLPTRE
jgi:hypothetical protein